MRALVVHRPHVTVEVEDAFPEDRKRRYLVLHFCGPQVSVGEARRRWRIEWDSELPPMLHVRGILFGVHFLVEVHPRVK